MSQRHPAKKYPNCWECADRSVLAGEDSMQGTLREGKEELGITLDVTTARLLYQTRREASQDYYNVWLFSFDGFTTMLKLAPDEVIDARWFHKNELCDLQNRGKLYPLIDYLDPI